jgi:hypothetical protein
VVNLYQGRTKYILRTFNFLPLTSIFHSKFLQNIFHQTPFGNGGLQKVCTHKSGKPQPVDIHINRQQQADDNKRAGNGSNDSV